MANEILIEVAYALPEKQSIVEVSVAEGATALDAVKASNIAQQFPEIEPDTAKMGIFGKAIKANYVLQAGDRIEIYRPLIADPKANRKARAEKAKAEKAAK